MKPKNKKIIEDSERENIPIFILTAKDINSTFAIEQYLKECENSGCELSFLNDINKIGVEFQQWQCENSKKTKIPD